MPEICRAPCRPSNLRRGRYFSGVWQRRRRRLIGPARNALSLELTIQSGDQWEEAISRNDLACYRQGQGDLDGAECEIEQALAVAHAVTSGNSFTLAVLHSTRADIRLLAGRAAEALADAERAISLLNADAEPNPYVQGVTVRAEVEARMARRSLMTLSSRGKER
jgi:hypothetical protein